MHSALAIHKSIITRLLTRNAVNLKSFFIFLFYYYIYHSHGMAAKAMARQTTGGADEQQV